MLDDIIRRLVDAKNGGRPGSMRNSQCVCIPLCSGRNIMNWFGISIVFRPLEMPVSWALTGQMILASRRPWAGRWRPLVPTSVIRLQIAGTSQTRYVGSELSQLALVKVD
ncbi:hypothetical protein CK203_015563 [Vitis vinifera]|uniref:Uncharacterized protein n=1 Tax=Vitis vinifera TaxID=29760 RepID=A0A438J5U0_VITVI|nr:hypothetical protein CK203_015563 [Vitis vinifera]